MQIKGDYILDLEKITEFIFEPSNEIASDSEITELYMVNDMENELELNSKQLREVKSNNDSNRYGVRYDLIKGMIDVMLMIDPEDVTFGEAVVMNTLLTNEMIKEIE